MPIRNTSQADKVNAQRDCKTPDSSGNPTLRRLHSAGTMLSLPDTIKGKSPDSRPSKSGNGAASKPLRRYSSADQMGGEKKVEKCRRITTGVNDRRISSIRPLVPAVVVDGSEKNTSRCYPLHHLDHATLNISDQDSKKTFRRTKSRLEPRRLFRESSKSADSSRRRGLKGRLNRNDMEHYDDDYVTPLNKFRKIARLVQLALIFYSGEGKTRRVVESNEVHEEKQTFFDKPDRMRFLPEFDPSLYKAQKIKELVVGSDIQDILGKRPADRTEEEIQQVLFALRTYETFAEYPLGMQERMCRKAHYLHFGANRIILRQGDRAEWFYYVLSGTTAVSILEENKNTGSVNLRNVGYLTRGTAFGELALLHGTRRTATVSCKDGVELIAVDKEDFVQMNQLDSDEEREHVRYCRTLGILQYWPVSLLGEVSGVCNFHFFKKGTVMAKSNHNTPFIYIVKSGHVKVLTKVTKIRRKLSAGCRVRSRSGNHSNSTQSGRITTARSYPSRINSGVTETSRPNRSRQRANIVPLLSRLSMREGSSQEVDIQPTFLQVSVLGAGDSFGLSSLVYSEEITCGIVSLGAECIEISKDFFLKNASENYLRKLKAMIRPFPSEDKLQQDIQDQKLWNNYKNSVVAQVLDPSSI